MFNNVPVKFVDDTNILELFWINSYLGTILRLRKYLPRTTLELMFKMIMRPHLEYGDIIFRRPPKTTEFSFDTHLKPLMQTIESLQYNAALAINGA